ncbi:M949_RS01915 family surface polysaccharide biosynthesis protein [Aureivirga sp. CE67]|uniref:M949_RS01915 family surface polysaccharide biosynthesis protein n=1 Tax=Aureivirga sp. CE67 TaxID=1788983 RepID=UPI0018C90EA3|nr:hypothetical protein [Aureivirga sp. CE67]
MKTLTTILILIISLFSFGQTEKDLVPELRLEIWDKENSDNSIKIETLIYDEIPKYIDFRGTVVQALKWTDSNGENILIQTITGAFDWKDYEENSTNYTIQDKSELYAYLFQKRASDKEFRRKWRVYDYTECYGVDWFTGFIPKATTITDLDKDGVSEITLPYVSICRGGVDPGRMKIIMYEGGTKYALRGSTMLMCKSEHPFGGDFKPSENLKNKKVFSKFLIEHWDRNKCENRKYY